MTLKSNIGGQKADFKVGGLSLHNSRLLREAFTTGSRFIVLITLLCITTHVGLASGAEGFTSTYSSLKEKDCLNLRGAVESYYTRKGLSGSECPAPAGWRLFVVSSDERSWLDFAHDGQLWTTEREVVSGPQFGFFPNIGSGKVEWLKKKTGGVSGLIFRVFAQDPDRVLEGGTFSRLYVYKLENDHPVYCGSVKGNQDARDLLQNKTACRIPLEAVALPK